MRDIDPEWLWMLHFRLDIQGNLKEEIDASVNLRNDDPSIDAYDLFLRFGLECRSR
jgi:hypothetical protein